MKFVLKFYDTETSAHLECFMNVLLCQIQRKL